MPYMLRESLKGLLLFIAYYYCARFGLKLSAVSGFASFIWLPTGISFAALFLWGRKFWPAIFLGATLVNFVIGAPVHIAILLGIGNTLEAVIGVTLFRMFSRKDSRLERVREVSAFVFFGAFLSTAISASIGVFSLSAAGIMTPDLVPSAWLTWWIGDMLSNLVFAPFIIVWSKWPLRKANLSIRIEGFILASLAIMICLIIFCEWPFPELDNYIKHYWIFILLTWTTLRFGQHANVLLTVVLSGIAIYGTMNGNGPYQTDSLENNLLLLQIFTGAVALCGLFFGALGREKNEAIRMRTDFISIASHELRTPVSSISLSVTVMKELFQGNENPLARQVIEALERQSKKLVRLVDSLLNVAQIESGSLILEKRETDISSLVLDVVNNLSDVIERSGSEIRTEISSGICAQSSAYGIEQVLTNLILNAVKYGKGNPIVVSLTRDGEYASLSIADLGRGIAPQNHERIFRRYERIDPSPDSQGLGIGLYVCKLIVEDHKGSIKVTSQENKGATFTVRLPL